MSEKVSTSVTIKCPHQVVWDYITTSENWKKWYTQGLIDVTPGWQNRAILRFDSGQKPTIMQCVPPNLLKWGKGTSLRLSEIDSSTTEIEYSITVEGMFAEDPSLMTEFRQSFLNNAGSMLEKLKNLLESEPIENHESTPAFDDTSAPRQASGVDETFKEKTPTKKKWWQFGKF